jgi:hypothetical protein
MMTRQKKRAYLTLMALGVVALAVDRLLLPGGATEPSTALALVSATTTAVSGDVASEAAVASSIPELPFPHELKPLAETSTIRDLFAPPLSAWDPDSEKESPDKPGSITGPEGRPVAAGGAAGLRKSRLNAVFITEGLKIAVVNKRQMAIGDVLDDCTLASISGNEVQFECPGESVVLYILDPNEALQH